MWTFLDQMEATFFEAIEASDEETVARLLNHDPTLTAAIWQHEQTTLQRAARRGHDTVVAQLLAASPELIDMVDANARTVLHWAAAGDSQGHEKVVARLLAARPSLIDQVDVNKWTVLHHACAVNNVFAAEMFLTLKPDLAFAATDFGQNTALHLTARWPQTGPLLERLLELNPEALSAVNCDGNTPFDEAVAIDNTQAIEVMQWQVAFDELLRACRCAAPHNNNNKSIGRLKPLMESQCEALLARLGRDVVSVVFEFIVFEKGKKRPRNAIRGELF